MWIRAFTLEVFCICVQLDEGPLEEPEIAYILQQVLRALAYVHAQQRVHRDVKAANVLLSAAGAVKMSDFGVAGQMTGASCTAFVQRCALSSRLPDCIARIRKSNLYIQAWAKRDSMSTGMLSQAMP